MALFQILEKWSAGSGMVSPLPSKTVYPCPNFRTCDCDLIGGGGGGGEVFVDTIKDFVMSLLVWALNSKYNNKYPQKKTKREKRQREKRRPCEDGGTDWSDAATDQ